MSQTMDMLSTKNLARAAMFIAIGLVLPFLTGQIPEIGRMLLPMHLPVLLCGLICGKKYGFTVGLILPIMRSLLFGMPIMFPMAIAMTFELATYGFIIGLIYSSFKKQGIVALYTSLIIAMIVGRIVWGVAMAVLLLGFSPDGVFTFQVFIAGAIVNALPGIILQLVLIPAIMLVLHRVGVIRFKK